ncbi:unnamed protein product, partial [Ectocarpus sp. 8 AP-2014]
SSLHRWTARSLSCKQGWQRFPVEPAPTCRQRPQPRRNSSTTTDASRFCGASETISRLRPPPLPPPLPPSLQRRTPQQPILRSSSSSSSSSKRLPLAALSAVLFSLPKKMVTASSEGGRREARRAAVAPKTAAKMIP